MQPILGKALANYGTWYYPIVHIIYIHWNDDIINQQLTHSQFFVKHWLPTVKLACVSWPFDHLSLHSWREKPQGLPFPAARPMMPNPMMRPLNSQALDAWIAWCCAGDAIVTRFFLCEKNSQLWPFCIVFLFKKSFFLWFLSSRLHGNGESHEFDECPILSDEEFGFSHSHVQLQEGTHTLIPSKCPQFAYVFAICCPRLLAKFVYKNICLQLDLCEDICK